MIKTDAVDTKRIQRWIRDAGKNQRALAEYLRISAPAVSNLLKGTRNLSLSEAFKISLFLSKSHNDVLEAFGVKPAGEGAEKIPIMGYVGAGDALVLYDVRDDDNGFDEIESPFPGYIGICVRVRGDSMSPRYLDGEIIAYRPGTGDIARLVGREAILKLVDGRLVLKRVQRGSEADRYTLVSINPVVEPIQNVEIEWAAPIDWHKP